jgi:hypothetical protein
MVSISNNDDVIDSRDVIERIEELENQDTVDDDDYDELTVLRALAAEASGYASDWQYGETLIRDSYFREYAEQLAEECDLIPEGAHWPMSCIDWEAAADELQMDYTSVDFDGVTYWIR